MDPIAGCGPACPVVWEGRQAQSCRLDPICGVARALVRNLRDMDFVQGASTISMQLARNTAIP